MATAIAYGWQVENVNGTPVSGARIYFFAPGTNTPRTTYTDSALAVPAANPVLADAAGWFNTYLSSELGYDIVVKSADDSITYQERTVSSGIDGAQPIDATLTALAGLTIVDDGYIQGTGADTFRVRYLQRTTYAALTAIAAADRFDGMRVFVSARTTAGDGGEGWWRFDSASATSANGGTVLAPDAGTGRWFRVSTKPTRVVWFGTDTAAMQAAITAAGTSGEVVWDSGSYTLTAILTALSSQTWSTLGAVTITKGFNGDMVDMSASAVKMVGFRLEGAGATYTGRGVIIGAGTDQKIDDCIILDCASACLEFTAADAGQRFRASDSIFRCTTITDAAILLPDAVETAGNRYFDNCGALGGTLLAFRQGINTILDACNFVALDFSGSTGTALRAIVSHCRWAAGGGEVTIEGGDVNIIGNVIAGSITLGTSTQRCKVSANGLVSGGTVTDNSTATGDNVNEVWDAYYTPTIEWKGDSSDPAIGNGTLTCRVYRSGRRLKVDVRLLVGSTTTFGSGAWYFQLPAPFSTWNAKHAAAGAAVMLDSGTQRFLGTATVNAAARRIYVNLDASASQINPTAPMTWATNDTLNVNIEYEIS